MPIVLILCAIAGIVFLLILSARRSRRASSIRASELATARDRGDHQRVREIEADQQRRENAAKAAYVASNTPGTQQHKIRWGK
jgi:hypothetical protein